MYLTHELIGDVFKSFTKIYQVSKFAPPLPIRVLKVSVKLDVNSENRG